MMQTHTDEVVTQLLADFTIDPKFSGASDAVGRLKLLHKALQKVQSLPKVLKEVKSSSSDGFDPSKLTAIDPNNIVVLEQFELTNMFTIQETIEDVGATWQPWSWTTLRKTVWRLVNQGVRRLQLVTKEKQPKMAVVLDVTGGRLTPGNVTVLETRHGFYRKGDANEACIKKELEKDVDGILRLTVPQNVLELLLLMLNANTAQLEPSYIAAQQKAWGADGHFTPSFLLPLKPLTEDITLPKQCNVCGAEGARDCSACRTVAYCSKDCQREDWKQHKAACKQAQAAGTDDTAPADTCVLVKLTDDFPSPYMTTVSMKASSSSRLRCDVQSEVHVAVTPDENKRLLVKIQAPMHCWPPSNTSLFLYDQKRTLVAYISPAQPAYKRLLPLLRSEGYLGSRLYFSAYLLSKESLKVVMDPLPTQTHNW